MFNYFYTFFYYICKVKYMQSHSNLLYCMLFQCYNYNQLGTAKRTITLIKVSITVFCQFRCYLFFKHFFTQKRRQKNEMRCQTISISLFHWSFSAHFNWSLERDENYFSFASLGHKRSIIFTLLFPIFAKSNDIHLSIILKKMLFFFSTDMPIASRENKEVELIH